MKKSKCKLRLHTTLSISNHQLHVSAKSHLQAKHITIVGNIYYNAMNVMDEIDYEYVLSLKMAFIAETCSWWLLIAKAVFRLNLHLFYCLVYLNTTGAPCLKTTESFVKYTVNKYIKIYTVSPNVTFYRIIDYRGADKSLTQPTSRCILFDGENISFDASLVIYIYIYSKIFLQLW